MVRHMSKCICKEVIHMEPWFERLTKIVKELSKLVTQLEKLTIRIVSLVGWIWILIKLFS